MKNINKYIELEPNQKIIRSKIMDLIIDKKRPVKLKEVQIYLQDIENVKESYIKNSIDTLIKNNIMVVDNDEVNFIYPVSANETMHKVKLDDGRELNAMCAIDALGTSITFGQDVAITSKCNVTGKTINIIIKSNNIHSIDNEHLRILHINLAKYENWAASC